MPRSSTNTSLIWQRPFWASGMCGTTIADFLGLVRVFKIEGPQALRRRTCRARLFSLFQQPSFGRFSHRLLRAVAAAAAAKVSTGGTGQVAIDTGFPRAVVDDPDEFWPVAPSNRVHSSLTTSRSREKNGTTVWVKPDWADGSPSARSSSGAPCRHVERDQAAVNIAHITRGPAARGRRWCCADGSRCRTPDGARAGGSLSPCCVPGSHQRPTSTGFVGFFTSQQLVELIVLWVGRL